jgi:hypothetical protein
MPNNSHERYLNQVDKVISCIGKDGYRHLCYPWCDKTICGEPVARKKEFKNDIELPFCIACDYDFDNEEDFECNK